MRQNHPLAIYRALAVATYAHDGQFRKTTGEPYIVHPEAVATILKDYGANEDIIAAGLLHDVLEDAPDVYSRGDMLRDFNEHIVKLVDCVTEDKLYDSGEPIPWIDRKEDYIKGLETAPNEALLVSIADKIHNLDSVLQGYKAYGDEVWRDFKSSPLQQFWYYTTLSDLFSIRLGALDPLVKQLRLLCAQLEEIVPREQGGDRSKYPSTRLQ